MGVEIMSTGWYLQLNRYFNVLHNITIITLYKSYSTAGNITQDEYMEILKNAWVGDYYTESNFRDWVSSGYLTSYEFKLITSIDY